jgi:hypothetical protein
MAFLPIPALFTAIHCRLSRTIFQNHFACPLFIGYGIAGNRATNRIPRSSRACLYLGASETISSSATIVHLLIKITRSPHFIRQFP